MVKNDRTGTSEVRSSQRIAATSCTDIARGTFGGHYHLQRTAPEPGRRQRGRTLSRWDEQRAGSINVVGSGSDAAAAAADDRSVRVQTAVRPPFKREKTEARRGPVTHAVQTRGKRRAIYRPR